MSSQKNQTQRTPGKGRAKGGKKFSPLSWCPMFWVCVSLALFQNRNHCWAQSDESLGTTLSDLNPELITESAVGGEITDIPGDTSSLDPHGQSDGDAEEDKDEAAEDAGEEVDPFEARFDWGEIKDLVQGTAEAPKDTGEFIWSVPRFLHLAKGGNALFPMVVSPKFYVSKPGFRVQLMLIPNMTYSEGTHYLGIFFRMVTGVYDSEVKWPYQLKTTLTVLDQSAEGGRSVPFTVTPNTDPCRLRSSFLRPSTDTDNTLRPDGCGNRRHISLESLLNSTGRYVYRETLMIKMVVHMKDVGESYKTATMTMKYNSLVSDHIWAIDNFPDIQREARDKDSVAVLSSDPFYTHPTGYLVQMFLTLLPKKKAFAISTALFQGDFDRNLEWPFPYHFEVALVDQSPDYWRRDYSVNLHSSSSDCGSTPFFHPTGYPEFCFITVQSAELLTLKHYNFIRNGTLKIRFVTKFHRFPERKQASLSLREGHLVAEYSWLVPDIENKLERFDYSGRKVKIFASDKFYTNGQGYLMQMILKLNHTEKTNGSMGLELSILEGENDGLLKWPFNNTFELLIINQRPQQQLTIAQSGSLNQPTPELPGPGAPKGDVGVVIEPWKETTCAHQSFAKPIERSPPCGRKSLISFARVSRSSGFIRLGSLLVKARIYLDRT